MPRRRVPPLLAMLAALLMAPSAVSAATPLPTVVIVDASPQPGSGNEPATTVSTPSGEPVPSLAPAPQPPATPQPSSAPAPKQEATAVLVRNESPGRSAPDRPRARDRTRPRPSRTRSAAPSQTPETAPSGTASTAPVPDADDTRPDGLGFVLLWGIASVGAMALLGTTWLLLARRRDPSATAETIDGSEMPVRVPMTAERRALRRARLRQDDDPILAGLGLDEETTRAGSPRPRRGGRPRP